MHHSGHHTWEAFQTAFESIEHPPRGEPVVAVDSVVSIAEVDKGQGEAPRIQRSQLGWCGRDLNDLGPTLLDGGIA